MNKKQKSDFLKTLIPVHDVIAESDQMFNILDNEVNMLSDILIEKPKEQPWRRVYIRSVFANIECSCFRIKQDAIFFCNQFSPGEVSLLKEKTYRLNKKGNVEERDAYLRAQDNLKFAFKSYAKAFDITIDLDFNDKGWKSYKEALKIRNRITHPKKFLDLVISDDDIKVVMEAHQWFHKNLLKVFKLSVKSLNKTRSKKSKKKT